MHRCYVDPTGWNESEMFLTADEEHHLLDVLRAKVGDAVAVFDGKGREANAIVSDDGTTGKNRHRVVLKAVSACKGERPGLSLTLIQALPKGRKMDSIVEKSVELGVTEIIPVISDHTIVRLDESARKERGERWQRLALSASRQCGTSWVPDVRSVCDYSEAIENCSGFDLLLIGSLGEDARSLHDVINEAKQKRINAAREDTRPPIINRATKCEEREGETPVEPKPMSLRAGIIIGPEGDLTPAEIKEAIDVGATPVSFGRLVLRVDTAALYGLSVLAYELAER